MKKFIVASLSFVAFAAPAIAADMPVKAPVMAAPVYNWTGFYVGATAGYGWGSYNQYSPTSSGPVVNPKDFIAGGTVGYNWQTANWVLGLEADFSSGIKGSDSVGTTGIGVICGSGVCDVNVTYFGTARARAGIAVNQWLLFGTAGLAYGRYSGGIQNSPQEGSSTKTGWTAGGGVEYAFYSKWSAKFEYLYVNLADAVFGAGALPGSTYNASGHFNVVRLGVNYHF
jgi:outer membrane immunogenic protein